MSAPMFIDPRLPWLEPARVALSPEEMVRWREYDEDSLDPEDECPGCEGTGRFYVVKLGASEYGVCGDCNGSGMA